MTDVLAATADERTPLRLPILNYAAGLAHYHGEPEQGIRLLDECLDLASRLGNDDFVAISC